MRASAHFTERELADIETAIGRAEEGTSGEIVAVVATKSGRYDRAEDLVGLLAAVVGLLAAWMPLQWARPAMGMWGTRYDLNLGIGVTLAVVLGGFFVGSLLAARIPGLRRLFLTQAHMRAEVERAAIAAFQTYGIRRARGGAGLLIYVSLAERRVQVMGDDAIASRLDQRDWNDIRDLVIGGLRGGRVAGGILAGVAKAGALLAEHFPPTGEEEEGEGEVPNTLRIVD